MLTITNVDASTHQVKNSFSQSSESEFYDIVIFFNLWRMGKGERGLITTAWNFIYTYIQTSARIPETEGLQESKKCSKRPSALTELNVSKYHDYL